MRVAVVTLNGESRRVAIALLLRRATYLLHDARLPLRKGNVPPRLITDKLNLDLPSLSATLIIVVVVILGAGSLALDAAGLVGGSIAVSDGVLLGDVGGRRLVVLVGDVAHGCCGFLSGCRRIRW